MSTPKQVGPVRMLWHLMRPQRRELWLAGLLGFLASFSAVALLGVSAWLIATAAGAPPVLTLTVAAVMVRALALSRAIFRYLERLVGHDAAFRGLTDVRVAVYSQLERLAPTGLRAFGRGDLLARLVADVDATLDLPLRIVLPWAQAALVAAGTVAFITWLLPASGALIAVASLIALAAIPWIASRMSASAQRRTAPARGAMADSVVRALDAAPDIAAAGATPAVVRRVGAIDDRLTHLSQRSAYALGLGSGLVVLVQGLAVVGTLVIAVPAVVDGRLGPVWLAVAALMPLALFEILSGLPGSALSLQGLRSSAGRLAGLSDEPSPIVEPVDPVRVPQAFTGLTVSGLFARWSRAEASVPDALRGLDFEVHPGQRIAVVGPSGAGKSTLAAVLMGFLPYSGSITLSGVELARADGDDLRRHVGLLSQSAHVFDTSVADNVRLGNPEADEAHLREAIDQARLSDYVDSLPRGIATTVGSFGATMSGGERQRLALARLLLAERSLVILDEPTEHLDGPTADALMATILDTMSQKALVVITHRLLGLEGFDRIIVLTDGELTLQGTHEELLVCGGWYADQWRLESERRDMGALLASLPVGIAVAGPRTQPGPA